MVEGVCFAQSAQLQLGGVDKSRVSWSAKSRKGRAWSRRRSTTTSVEDCCRSHPARQETTERIRKRQCGACALSSAQELGFTLREIEELLSLRATPRARCVDVRERARTKVSDIDDKVRTLVAMRNALTQLVDECAGKEPATECPILEALDSENEQE